ncbi:MAG: ribonuclease III [Mycoplasmatales bacterium]
MESLYELHNLHEVEEKINLEFEDKELLVKAFIHPSFNAEVNQNYQRLEFLGDAIAQMIVSDYLYRKYPQTREGDMSKTRSALVAAPSFGYLVNKLNLEQYIIVGPSMKNTTNIKKDSFKADIFESLLGAIYLDKGIMEAEKFVHETIIKNKRFLLSQEQIKDYKTQIQEKLQINGQIEISYKTEKQNEIFVAKLFVEGTIIGRGQGKSKKEAEQQAAKNALVLYK